MFDCVSAMTTALKQKKKSCNLNHISKNVSDKSEKKDKDEEEDNSKKKGVENSIDQKIKTLNSEEEKDKEKDKEEDKEKEKEEEEKEKEDSVVIPLLCKIRICEDGVDSYTATEDFCKGTVSYRTVRYGSHYG